MSQSKVPFLQDVSLLLDDASDLSEWIKRAKGMNIGEGYRGKGVSDLADVATDPDAPKAQRLGAALGMHDAPAELKHRVRVSLEGMADEEMEAIEDALEGKTKRLKKLVGH